MNLAPYITTVIEQWGFSSKLGYFTMDNASNNNTCIQQLAEELRTQFDVCWDPLHHRIRCQDHVINLVAHSFLYATKDEVLECDEDIQQVTQTPEEMSKWRKRGPLGKLHNQNTWIFGSPRCLEQFELLAGCRILRDNETRCNSWYAQIEVALSVCEVLESYVQVYGEEKPEASICEDLFSNED